MCFFSKLFDNVTKIFFGLRVCPSDKKFDWLCNKLVAGKNIKITHKHDCNSKLEISSEVKSNVSCIDKSGRIDPSATIVRLDASKEHLVVTLPSAKFFHGPLYFVCDANGFGIEVVADKGDEIFDKSNFVFNVKGDAFVLVSDGSSNWIVVGKYTSLWYA